MPISKDKREKLKRLGDIYWKDALAKGYYNSDLLYNKVPKREILTTEVLEECSNTKVKLPDAPNGILFNVILDREFLISKTIRHLLYCFTKKEDLNNFIDEALEYYEKHKQAESAKVLLGRKVTLNDLRELPKEEAIEFLKMLASELDIDAKDLTL